MEAFYSSCTTSRTGFKIHKQGSRLSQQHKPLNRQDDWTKTNIRPCIILVLFDATSELGVTMYDQAILNVALTAFSGFSAEYYYTG